jgi:hypothetical protein
VGTLPTLKIGTLVVAPALLALSGEPVPKMFHEPHGGLLGTCPFEAAIAIDWVNRRITVLGHPKRIRRRRESALRTNSTNAPICGKTKS